MSSGAHQGVAGAHARVLGLVLRSHLRVAQLLVRKPGSFDLVAGADQENVEGKTCSESPRRPLLSQGDHVKCYLCSRLHGGVRQGLSSFLGWKKVAGFVLVPVALHR